MKQLLMMLLFSMSSFCNAQNKPQPQFIKFEQKLAHPELQLASYVPLYISTAELNLPLPDAYVKLIEHEKKTKPDMSEATVDKMKELFLRSVYDNLVIDRKLFDFIHEYILKNSNLLVIKPRRPACLIVIDNKSRYLPQSKMKKFYHGLKLEILSKK